MEKLTLTDYGIYGKVTFYKDDFMLALKNRKGNSFKKLTNKDFDDLKFNYLQNHIDVFANGNPDADVQGKKLQLIITGNNENESSIWFDFKFNSDEKIKSLEIKNDVLINEFSDQMNLLNINSSSGDQSLIFSKSKQKLLIKS